MQATVLQKRFLCEQCKHTRISFEGSGSQVWVGVVPVGPKGTALNSSYNNRDSREYKEDLGYAVVNFARMVPDGLLVFFPSYGVLKNCTDFWKNTSVGGTGTCPVDACMYVLRSSVTVMAGQQMANAATA